MKVKFILALSAILLAFVVVSCDTSTTPIQPTIPTGLRGYYTFGEHTVVIYAGGSGNVNGTPALFSVSGNVLTVTMEGQTISVVFAINNDTRAVTFTELEGAQGELRTVFEALVAYGPIVPDLEAPAAIPEVLVGSWAVVNEIPNLTGPDGSYTLPAGSIVFVINSDGTGSARNEWFATHDDAEWTVSGDRITLTMVGGLGIGLACTYTWSYDAVTGHLTISNPSPADSPLAAYVNYAPFVRTDVEPPPSPSDIIDAVEWDTTIREEFTGTWTTIADDFAGRRVFAIRANGTGYIYLSSIPGFYAATYRLNKNATATSGKLLIYVEGFGRVMYTVTIDDNTLTLDNPIVDGNPALGAYGFFFNPLTRTPEGELPIELPFDYSEFTWHTTIPATHTGTWSHALVPGLYVINANGSGTVYVGLPGEGAPFPALFALSTDNAHLLITIPLLGGRILFEVSNPEENQLVLGNVIADAGGEAMALGYGALSPLTRNDQP